MLQTVRAEKVHDKNGGHLSSFHIPFLSYGPYIVKKVHFFAILCWFSQKSKSIYVLSPDGSQKKVSAHRL